MTITPVVWFKTEMKENDWMSLSTIMYEAIREIAFQKNLYAPTILIWHYMNDQNIFVDILPDGV